MTFKRKNCKKCGKEYIPNYNSQKYCEECRKRTCEYCGKIFTIKKSKFTQRFCSKHCRALSISREILIICRKDRHRNRKNNRCIVCGKEFEHWAGRNRKYCSRDCWAKRNPPVLHHCLYCGKEFWCYKSTKRKYCSEICDDLHRRELLKGQNSHFWKGGKTKLNTLERNRAKYAAWRDKVFQRDNYICQDCGLQSGQGHKIFLQAHHIKPFAQYPKLRYVVSNGITLCKNCHLLRHSHKF